METAIDQEHILSLKCTSSLINMSTDALSYY